MIPVDKAGASRLCERLGYFEGLLDEARRKHEEAEKLAVEAGARLMARLIEVLGPGVLNLVNAMVRGQDRFADRLVQLAKLATGEGSEIIEATIINYGVEGSATLFVIKTDEGIALGIEVSRGANPATLQYAQDVAEDLGVALGFKVRVDQKKTYPDPL